MSQDLLDQIDFKSLECLNANPSHTAENALKKDLRDDDSLFLESDADEQLLIHIGFSSAVKVSGIAVRSIQSPNQAPLKVKLFVNKPTIGFSDAQDLSAVQEIKLDEKLVQGDTVPLKFVKFQNVNSLTLFVESNQGDEDTTIIQQLKFFGNAGGTFKVSEIKKVEED